MCADLVQALYFGFVNDKEAEIIVNLINVYGWKFIDVSSPLLFPLLFLVESFQTP